MVAAFQTHFAAQNGHYARQGSRNNSLPISRGQIGFIFYMKGVHNTSLKRETVRAPTELLGEELCYHFTAKSGHGFQSRSVTSTAPCQWYKHTFLFCTFWCFNSPCLHEIRTSCAGPLICPNTGNSLYLFSFWATCLWTMKTSICYANLSSEPADVTFGEDPTFSTVVFFPRDCGIWFTFSFAPCVKHRCCLSAGWWGGDQELFVVSRVWSLRKAFREQGMHQH